MQTTRTVLLPVDRTSAWELLTDPDELATWLGSVAGALDDPAAVGGAVRRLTEPDGTTRQLVVDRVDTHQRIGFVWWGGDERDGEVIATRVDIALEEADGGCVVTVTESAPVRASVAGGIRRLPVGASWNGGSWDSRLLDLECRALLRATVLV
jgi:uncharacterized protein YndB with AHSA1/START domain